MKEELILRDILAVDRTQLANQRTLLAFIRTGLYLIITGIGVREFSQAEYTYMISVSLMIIGVVVALMGAINYFRVKSKIKKKLQNTAQKND